jgi:hypothetical protein
LVEYWLGVTTPRTVNIPKLAITEMLRIGEPPIGAQIHKDSVTFHYADERWIRTQLFETEWPDLSKVMNQDSVPLPVDERIFEALEMLKPFADDIGRVYFAGNVIRTHPPAADAANELGASYDAEGLAITGLYQIKILELLKGAATHADFSRYPEPVLFFGERLRGAMLGMKDPALAS